MKNLLSNALWWALGHTFGAVMEQVSEDTETVKTLIKAKVEETTSKKRVKENRPPGKIRCTLQKIGDNTIGHLSRQVQSDIRSLEQLAADIKREAEDKEFARTRIDRSPPSQKMRVVTNTQPPRKETVVEIFLKRHPVFSPPCGLEEDARFWEDTQ